MKMKDLLKIEDYTKKCLTEAEKITAPTANDANKELLPSTEKNDIPGNVPGKTVIPRKKRYVNDVEDYDEEQNFYKRDSNAEYTRDMATADEIFNQTGLQDKKNSEEFFNIFPKIEAKDPALVKEAISDSKRNNKALIIEHSKNKYTLVNHDKFGTMFENNISYDLNNRRFIIECTDPEAFNIIQNVNRGDRYKHSLRSKELQYILEFQSMTGAHCYIKMKNNNLALKI